MIHFAHGNGFPASCYRQFLEPLRSEHEVITVDMIGHDPSYPITENWPYLVKELTDNIKSHSSQPVIGLGHSFGGVLTLMAAHQAPQLFKKVIMLDSPVFGFRKSALLRLIKQLNLVNLVTPSRRIAKRLSTWPNKDSLRTYLLSKSLYSQLDPLCLEDYIRYGISEESDGSYRLRFDRTKESLIFKTVPHNIYRCFTQQKQDVLLIYGTSSDMISKRELRKMSQHYAFAVKSCPGGHMFPLEVPKQAADLVLQSL